MLFNKIWTKQKNDLYRNFIKEGKSVDFIKDYFGEDLKHHPKGKYQYNHLKQFDLFEKIIIDPIETPYSVKTQKSWFYPNKTDYILEFVSNQIFYIIYLMYYEVNTIGTYNIILTTRDNYNSYDLKINEFIQKGYISEPERNILISIIEKETNYNDIYGIVKRLSYILFDFYKQIPGSIFSVGDTPDNPVKIRLYRNIIKDSFKNIIETKVLDEQQNIYYLYK
jgi:hypothetical protein